MFAIAFTILNIARKQVYILNDRCMRPYSFRFLMVQGIKQIDENLLFLIGHWSLILKIIKIKGCLLLMIIQKKRLMILLTIKYCLFYNYFDLFLLTKQVDRASIPRTKVIVNVFFPPSTDVLNSSTFYDQKYHVLDTSDACR